MRFSEGSSIVLERGGRLRVLSLESNGARVLVEKGAADVAIAHRRGPGRWRFEAGPGVRRRDGDAVPRRLESRDSIRSASS